MHTITRSSNLARLDAIAKNRIKSYKEGVRGKITKAATIETTKKLIERLSVQPRIYTMMDGRILLSYKNNNNKASISILEDKITFYVVESSNPKTVEILKNVDFSTKAVDTINTKVFAIVSAIA